MKQMRTNFYLDKANKDRKGLAPIFFYISHRGYRLKFYTGERIKEKNWDPELQRAKPGASNTELLNDLLDDMEAEPKAIERKARINKIDCTIEHLRENLTYFQPKASGFFEIFDEYMKTESVRKSWSHGTTKQWKQLKAGLLDINKRYKVEFESINQSFANRFISWAIGLGWTNTTIKKKIQQTIQFTRWAYKNKYHYSESFRDIDVELKQVDPTANIIYLTLDELTAFNNLQFKEQETGLDAARDVFIFQCFTGIRYSDLKDMKRTQIKEGRLYKSQVKTRGQISIPLAAPALKILEKYKDLPGENPLPVISDQKYNDHLKVIAKRAGLNYDITIIKMQGAERLEETFKKWEKISTHVGRKTFVTLAIHLGIPLEIAAEFSGHKTDEIRRYYRILDSKQVEEMNKLNTILKVV